MPAAIAALVRTVCIAAMQIGAFEVARVATGNAFNYIQQVLVENELMSADQAEEAIAAEVLSFAAGLGASATLFHSRLPLRITNRLQRVQKKPTLTPTGKSTNPKKPTWLGTKVSNLSVLGALGLAFAGTAISKAFWIDSTIQNFLDQGTFAPAAANRALRALGLGGIFQWPETPKTLQPGTYDATEFIELYNQLTAAGAVGINNTFELQTQIWNKENLSELINTIVGTLILQGKKSDKTAIKAELPKYVINAGGGTGVSQPLPGAAGGGSGTAVKPAPPQILIYTGIVAGGTLGKPQEFIARPDDMIDSTEELKAAAKNNLASFVAALPGKFYYEIGIQTTVKTRSGFTQKGEAVKVISGYYKNGNPRYKTVYHKFAVMKLGVTDENGRNIKLGTIVLGPVNVVDYSPSQVELTNIQNQITPELFTSDITEIKEVISPAPIGVTTSAGVNPNPPASTGTQPTTTPSPTPPKGTAVFTASNTSFTIPAGGEVFIPLRPHGITPQVYARSGDIVRVFNLESMVPRYACGPYACYRDDTGNEVRVDNAGQVWDLAVKRFKAKTGIDYYSLPQQNIADVQAAFGRGQLSTLPNQLRTFEGPNAFNDFVAFLGALLPGGDIDITGGVTTLNDAARAATTLGQFYAAIGKPLPPLTERAVFYESVGLGPKSTYVGTAEQNNRLLAYLKS